MHIPIKLLGKSKEIYWNGKVCEANKKSKP